MRKPFVFRFLLIAFMFCLNRVDPVRAELFSADEFFLDNGLQVIVVPNHKAPIVKHMLWYKAGRVDEPVGKGGIAHLLEHLMFRGTHKIKDGEFNRLIENNGGDSNAMTSYDYTAYHQFLSVSRLELAMYLEADRMQNLSFSDEAFEKERDIVYQERRQRTENHASARFWESFRRLIYGETPYAEPVIGRNQDILNITKEDVLDFYQKYYTPSNAVLIISGDIDAATAKKLVHKYYGGISKRPAAKRAENLKLSQNASAELHVFAPQVKTHKIFAEFILPPDLSETEKYALMIFAQYLDGNTGLLYRKLVVQDKLAVSAGAGFDILTRGNNTFFVAAETSSEQSAEKLKKKISILLKQAAKTISAADLAKEKQKITVGFVYANDNPSSAATSIGQWIMSGYGINDINKLEQNINAVTLTDIRAAAVRLLRDASLHWGVLSPEKLPHD